MARGREELADLAERAERAYAAAGELHFAVKLHAVERLSRSRQQSGRRAATTEVVGVPAYDLATLGRLERRLARSVRAPRLARHALVEWLAGSLPRRDEERATLAVSELVNNAATHGSGEITMQADLDPHRLRVEVTDQGTGFVYQRPQVGLEQLSRRGLAIVDAIASRWGIRRGTSCVWFELERIGP